MKFLLTFSLLLASFNLFAYTVLLDPGHGGDELGAVGIVTSTVNGSTVKREIFEKDLALSLSLKVRDLLLSEVNVFLTRSMDRTVDLHKRAQIADTVKADLFISIHFNSATDHVSNGFETYYLNNHGDQAVKKVEEEENKSIDSKDKIVNEILIDLIIQKTVVASKALANLVHTETSKSIRGPFKRKNRGVKAGLFYVLALSKRPGVLIEAGFVSNPKELLVISTDKYLDAYAQAIASGIIQYKKSLK